jgi:hypothetical protein
MSEPKTATGIDRFRATPLRGWKQRFAHVVALAVGWALFAWGWVDVLAQTWEIELLAWLIAGSVVTLPTITLAWILHNVGIHRRKGPRTRLRPVDEVYLRDWNGRAICADLPALALAHIVVIEIEGERKVYRPAGAPGAPVIVPHTAHPPAANAPDGHGPAEQVDWRAA